MNSGDQRIMFVHAHPDDESIETGATMAKYAVDGAHVTLVTCTLGEEGEIVPPELAHLAVDRADALGPYRIGELATACAALGVTDQRFLGGAGRWRDSGMMGAPTNDRPDCFWRADVDTAAAELVAIIREVRPQVLVTYDARGYYGHPDHIQAHRVASRAYRMAGDAAFAPGTGKPWAPRKFYATAAPRSVLAAGLTRLRAARTPFTVVTSIDELPFGVPDAQVTTRVDARGHLDAKTIALRAHATQISLDPPFYALTNGIGQELSGIEHYTLLETRVPDAPAEEPETDLFHGVHHPV